MTHKDFSAFIDEFRGRFDGEANNVMAFALAKPLEKVQFLEIILRRYRALSDRYSDAGKRFTASIEGKSGQLDANQLALMAEMSAVTTELHLEIDSFFIFAKMMLDRVAHALEYFLGSTRGLPLDSHDDLTKNLAKIAEARHLAMPDRLMEIASSLKSRISDYRDYQIAHEKSPRTVRWVGWNQSGKAVQGATRIYPKPSDQFSQSEDPEALFGETGVYLGKITEFLTKNLDHSPHPKTGK